MTEHSLIISGGCFGFIIGMTLGNLIVRVASKICKVDIDPPFSLESIVSVGFIGVIAAIKSL